MLGNLAVGHSFLVTIPLVLEVAVATVVVVAMAATVVVVAMAATVVFVATVVVVTGTVTTGATVVDGRAFHLSFLPTLVQIRGLDVVPAKAPALEQLPPTLAADTCWEGTTIAKTLATTTAIILKVLNIVPA